MKLEKPPYRGIRFTVCCHLAFLCSDLQELGGTEERRLWKFAQSLFMPSKENEKILFRELAQSYAGFVRSVVSLYRFVERGGEENASEYYIKGFRTHQFKQGEMEQRALKYVQKYELGGPANI